LAFRFQPVSDGQAHRLLISKNVCPPIERGQSRFRRVCGYSRMAGYGKLLPLWEVKHCHCTVHISQRKLALREVNSQLSVPNLSVSNRHVLAQSARPACGWQTHRFSAKSFHEAYEAMRTQDDLAALSHRSRQLAQPNLHVFKEPLANTLQCSHDLAVCKS